MPPRSHRDLALDGLRGLAILLVFAFHYGGGLRSQQLGLRILGHLAEAGWTGVVLFFALSGFLITAGLWPALLRADQRRAEAPSRPVTAVFRHFYLRRAFRILPLYLLAVGLAWLAALLAHTSLGTLAIYALFLQDIPGLAQFAIAHPPPLPLYHLWSLAVEEQFYLLWPALLLLAARTRSPRRAALHLCGWIFVLAAAFRIAVFGFTPHAQLFDTFLLTHAGALALGAALSLAMVADDGNSPQNANSFPPTLNRLALPALLLGLTLYMLTSWLSGSFQLASPLQYMAGLPAVSLAAAALLPLALRAGVARRLLSLRPLRWLGRISYGFYVFHILLQPLFDRIALALAHTAAGSLYQTVRLLVAFPMTLLAAWLSFHLLEGPVLRRSTPFSHPAKR